MVKILENGTIDKGRKEEWDDIVKEKVKTGSLNIIWRLI